MLVTRAEGNVVYELNGQPAVDVFADSFGINEAVRLEAGTHHATHSLGICESTGRYSVRQVIGVASDSALVCASSIPEGVAVRWMAATPQDKATATRDAAQIAHDNLGAARPAAALVFPASTDFGFHCPTTAKHAWAALRDIVGHSTPIAGCGAAVAVATTHHGIPELHSQASMTFLFGI